MTAPDRAALSRETIAQAALDLTNSGGLSALSMRKLGSRLGVEAMSLYHYVDSKDDLLDAVLDELYRQIELPYEVADTEWEKAVREGLTAFRRVLTDNEAALELFVTRPLPSDAAYGVLLWAFGRFTNQGLDRVQAQQAVHMAVSFVVGHVANEFGLLSRPDAEMHVALDKVKGPEAREFLEARLAITSDDMFDAGLDAVVAGLRVTYDLP